MSFFKNIFLLAHEPEGGPVKNSFLSCLLVLSLVLAGAAGPLAADGIHSTTFDCHDPQHPNQSTSGPGVKIIERSRAMPNLPDFRGLNQADEIGRAHV